MARYNAPLTARALVATSYCRVMGITGMTALLLSLAACNASEKKAPQRMTDEETPAVVAAGGRGLAKLNPHPTKAYDLTVTVHDAPGPFAIVLGLAQYDVTNYEQCGQIHPVTGTRRSINSIEDFPLTQISPTEYRGRFYPDLMQDEDYYGSGICHWELTNLGATLRATGTEGETRFSASNAPTKLLAGAIGRLYYPNMDYPRAEIDSYPSFGEEDPRTYKAELQDQLFSVSLKVDEVRP